MAPYRRDISEACNWHQSEALNSTIYTIDTIGPTGYLLKEEGEPKNFKVFLGDLHNCTCQVFKKEKDLCKHVCWVLLKKFRVSRTDPISWQLGLNEREINQILRGDCAAQERTRTSKIRTKKDNGENASNPNEIEQRAITSSDICPICQDELLAKKLPVTHCRFGCGNNVHIKCMKVWADHQKTNGETTLKCPLCRETFCSFETLEQEYRNNGLAKSEKLDLHYGITCAVCRCTPISGKCYKCTSCAEYHLCQACFNTDVHKEHSFVFREKINQKYKKASRECVGAAIPAPLAAALMTRDLTDSDYEQLLRLDAQAARTSANQFSQIPEKVIKAWSSERVRENSTLLAPGYQCRICLRAYKLNEVVRKLPTCKHKFHADCIDNWLLHSHPTCPIDGLCVYDPVTAQQAKQQKLEEKAKQCQVNKLISGRIGKFNSVEMPALGLLINYRTFPVENKPSRPINEVHPFGITKKSFAAKLVASKGATAKPPSLTHSHSTSLLEKAATRHPSHTNLNFQVAGRNLSASTIESQTTSVPITTASLHRTKLSNTLARNQNSDVVATNSPFSVISITGGKPYQLSQTAMSNQTTLLDDSVCESNSDTETASANNITQGHHHFEGRELPKIGIQNLHFDHLVTSASSTTSGPLRIHHPAKMTLQRSTDHEIAHPLTNDRIALSLAVAGIIPGRQIE